VSADTLVSGDTIVQSTARCASGVIGSNFHREGAPVNFCLPSPTLAALAFKKLIYWNEVDKGGHFAANEQPQLFAEEMRAAFRSLRQQ
jgi:pimeloyl-ACP methyl ester carboxylesterase